jgi:tetratricopeptide (TPR) repeat protein
VTGDADLAHDLVNRAIRLAEDDRVDEARELYGRVVARFGDDPDPAVQEQVARALVWEGATFAGEEELARYDLVVARFGASTTPEVLEEVARAIGWKAHALADAKRWDEALGTCDALAARFAGVRGGVELREQLAWALVTKGRALGELGRHDEQLAVYDEAVARFGEDDEHVVIAAVAHALERKANRLYHLGRREESLDAYGEVVRRCRGVDDEDLATAVLEALRDRSRVLYRLERYAEAMSEADELLALLGEPDPAEPDDVDLLLEGLAIRGACLEWLERWDEATLVYRGLLAAYDRLDDEHVTGWQRITAAQAATGERRALRTSGRTEDRVEAAIGVMTRFASATEPKVRAEVVAALLDECHALTSLERWEEADALPATVGALYGTTPEADDEVLEDEAYEAGIAELLASALAGARWDVYAAAEVDASLAEPALELYRASAPLLQELARRRDWDSPRFGALLLVRSLADGCALLSAHWEDGERPPMSLPNRAAIAAGLEQMGLDEWAAEAGHPLEPAPAREAGGDPVPVQIDPTTDGFARSFARTIRIYAFIGAVHSAPAVAAPLHAERYGVDALQYIVSAHQWMARLAAAGSDGVEAVIPMLFFGQAYFVAASSEDPGAEWFPGRELVRDLLVDAEALPWLEQEGTDLPGWLDLT